MAPARGSPVPRYPDMHGGGLVDHSAILPHLDRVMRDAGSTWYCTGSGTTILRGDGVTGTAIAVIAGGR